MDNRSQLAIGAAVLLGLLIYLAPFRQYFVNFNVCVQEGIEMSKQYGGWTESDRCANAVHYCNSGTI